MFLGGPVAGLGKREPAGDAPVRNGKLSVLIDPPLVTKQIMHARGDLVPRVEVASARQQHVHLPHGLELHAFAPELGLDARLLPEREVAALGVAGAYGRVVRHLFGHEPEAAVFPDTLVRLT